MERNLREANWRRYGRGNRFWKGCVAETINGRQTGMNRIEGDFFEWAWANE